jgi:hypothetical protein
MRMNISSIARPTAISRSEPAFTSVSATGWLDKKIRVAVGELLERTQMFGPIRRTAARVLAPLRLDPSDRLDKGGKTTL